MDGRLPWRRLIFLPPQICYRERTLLCRILTLAWESDKEDEDEEDDKDKGDDVEIIGDVQDDQAANPILISADDPPTAATSASVDSVLVKIEDPPTPSV